MDIHTIEGLDNPELFGLPRSVRAIQAAKEGEELLTALTNLGGSVEEFSTEEETVSSLLLHTKDKLPPLLILQERFLLRIVDKDMSDILQREVEGLNNTIHGTKNTIDNAILLLKTGNCNGKENIAEDVAKNIPLGRTPVIWKNFDSLPTPQILQSFINYLWMRNAFFNQWITEECPTKFWLGSFQYLPAFLSLVLRQASLSYGVPLHLVDWNFEFTEDPSPDPSFLLTEVFNQRHASSRDDDEDASDVIKTDEVVDAVVEEDNPFLTEQAAEDRLLKQSRWREMAKNGMHVYGLWLVGAAWEEKQKVLFDAPGRQMIQLLPILKMTPSTVIARDDLTEKESESEEEIEKSLPSIINEDIDEMMEHLTYASSNELHIEEDTLTTNLSLKMHTKKEEMSCNKSEIIKTGSKIEMYICPVYEGSPENSQSPVVFTVPMPAGPKGANHWVQRRVAIYTSKI